MITEKELRQRLKAAVAGNISKWARENGLENQRANISLMMAGYRKISAKVAKKIGCGFIKSWEETSQK